MLRKSYLFPKTKVKKKVYLQAFMVSTCDMVDNISLTIFL